MIVKMLARNLTMGTSRVVITALTVAGALLVNALYVSYHTPMAAQTKYIPGEARLVVLTPKDDKTDTDWLRQAGTVDSFETFHLLDGFIKDQYVPVWAVSGAPRVAAPALVPPGKQPSAPGEAVVPAVLAGNYGLGIGSPLSIFSPGAGLAAVPDLRVVGASEDPLFPCVVTVLPDSSTAGGFGGKARVLVRLTKGIPSRSFVQEVAQTHPDITAVPLEEFLTPTGVLVSAADVLQSQLVMLILIIAAFGIANSMALSMLERRNQTALLRAVGLPRQEITLLFLAEAAVLAMAGSAIAFAGAWAASRFLPGAVAYGLPKAILRGSGLALAVGLGATLALANLWQLGSPMELLRGRSS